MESDILRRVLEAVLHRCIEEGLVEVKASPSTPA